MWSVMETATVCLCVYVCVCVCERERERETEQWGRGGWKERIGESLDIGKSWAVGRFFVHF